MNNRLVAFSLAVLGTTVFWPSAAFSASRAGASRAGRTISRGHSVRTNSVHPRRFFAGSAFAPYFYPDDYDDFEPEPGIEMPPPGVMAMQSAEPTAPAPVPKPSDPLVLELQGDHWVRITPYGPPQVVGQSSQPEPVRASSQPSTAPPATRRRTEAAKPPSELPPAVLVFRDGHQEEIGKYMISGTTIYVSTDYWSSGSWTRKVQLAELDVPATLKLNQERGANFRLPSGPDEVMVRP
jgi:hypothetical protein